MKLKDQIKQDVQTAMKAAEAGHRLVFGYLGMPGIGKTQMVHAIGEELEMDVWSGFNISAASPMDVAIKMPDMEEGVFKTLPSDDFPWESVVGDRKVLLFIDEVTNGTSDTIKSIQRLVNEGRLGEHKLGKNVVTILAGNRQSDKAGSGTLSTAMYNRVTWRNIEWTAKNSDDALEYITSVIKSDGSEAATEALSVVNGYFSFKPIIEGDFTDALKRLGKEPYVQWCSPRSLMALMTRVSANGWKLPSVEDMAGDIGMGRASELNNFAKVISKLEKYEKIVANPKEAKLPDSVENKYAMVATLAQRLEPADLSAVWDYVSRIEEVTLRIVFVQLAVRNHPEILTREHSKAYSRIYDEDKELKSALTSMTQ